jgi:hypothetical protein
MSHTRLQACAALAVAALCAAGLFWQHRENVRLKAENAGLRQLAAPGARLPGATRPPPAAASGPNAPAPAVPSASPRAPAPGRREGAGVPLASGLTPVETLGNAGRATPRAAFATQLWAARTGDIALEASALAFGPEARARLEALLQTLPPEIHNDYDTPEMLMAFMLAGSPHPVGGVQVLSEVADGPNDVTLQTEWQHVDDSIVHQSEANLHQYADGWKLVVPLGLVNRAANYLTRTLSMPAAPNPGG